MLIILGNFRVFALAQAAAHGPFLGEHNAVYPFLQPLTPSNSQHLITLFTTLKTPHLQQRIITVPAMPVAKEQVGDVPEGLVPAIKLEPPPGFEQDEWEQLTDVIITAIYHSLC